MVICQLTGSCKAGLYDLRISDQSLFFCVKNFPQCFQCNGIQDHPHIRVLLSDTPQYSFQIPGAASDKHMGGRF